MQNAESLTWGAGNGSSALKNITFLKEKPVSFLRRCEQGEVSGSWQQGETPSPSETNQTILTLSHLRARVSAFDS